MDLTKFNTRDKILLNKSTLIIFINTVLLILKFNISVKS